MRSTKRCPKCKGQKIGCYSVRIPSKNQEIRRLQIGIETIDSRIEGANIAGGYRVEIEGLQEKRAILQNKLESLTRDFGEVRYVCVACGFCEMYLSDPSALTSEDSWQWLEPPDGPPYR